MCYKYNMGAVKESVMNNSDLKREEYLDIEDIIGNSLSDHNISDDKEDLLLEYMCQTISKSENLDSMLKRARQGDEYAYIQLASWYISHAENIKDYCLAFSYAKKAIKNGYIEAYYILGQLYFYGTGCTKNDYRAAKCFKNFVEDINPKYLLNESVLADAYIKLASLEKKRGRYDKVNYYYEKLANIFPDYQIYYDEYLKEVKQQQSENTNGFIYALVSLIFLVCGGVCLFQFIQNDKTIHNFELSEKVRYVNNKKEISESDVPADVLMTERILYKIVTKDDFDTLNMSEINVAGVDATSTFISKAGNNYSPYNLVDHQNDTYWQEGEEGDGIGQKITFSFSNQVMLNGISISNGKQNILDSDHSFTENNRIKKIELVEDDRLTIVLPDEQETVYILFEEPIIKEKVTIILREVYKGTKYNDTCLSEISFYE